MGGGPPLFTTSPLCAAHALPRYEAAEGEQENQWKQLRPESN